MPTLNECMENIRKLVKGKGHEDSLSSVYLKLLFAFIELGEASNLLKKGGFLEVEKMQEELIDVIFYILDAYGILERDITKNKNPPDSMFEYKLIKNLRREYRYGRPK